MDDLDRVSIASICDVTSYFLSILGQHNSCPHDIYITVKTKFIDKHLARDGSRLPAGGGGNLGHDIFNHQSTLICLLVC